MKIQKNKKKKLKMENKQIENEKPQKDVPLSNFVADNEGNVFFDGKFSKLKKNKLLNSKHLFFLTEHSLEKWNVSYHSSRRWLVCIDESNWSVSLFLQHHFFFITLIFFLSLNRNWHYFIH